MTSKTTVFVSWNSSDVCHSCTNILFVLSPSKILCVRSVSRAWSSIFNPHVFKSLNQWPKISSESVMTPSRRYKGRSWINVSNTLNHICTFPKIVSYRPTPTAISHQLFLNPKEMKASWHAYCHCTAGCFRMWKRETDFAVCPLVSPPVGSSVGVLEKMPFCPELRLSVPDWD